MLGCRKRLGAAMIADTAPSTDASPQPNAYIQLTRTPSRRLVTGPTDAARRPSPSFVNRKNPHSRVTPAMQTTNVPTSWRLTETPPTWNGLAGNGLGNGLTSGPQIHPARPFSAMNKPIVTMITVN